MLTFILEHTSGDNFRFKGTYVDFPESRSNLISGRDIDCMCRGDGIGVWYCCDNHQNCETLEALRAKQELIQMILLLVLKKIIVVEAPFDKSIYKSKQQSSSAIVMPPLIRNLQTGEEFVDIIPDRTAEFFLGKLSTLTPWVNDVIITLILRNGYDVVFSDSESYNDSTNRLSIRSFQHSS